MDKALISLLKEKDLEYITVKEICEKAGVNRSTFYLHYETVADLVNEAIETVNQRFMSYFADINGIEEKLDHTDLSNLVLVKQDYLYPYLRFVSETGICTGRRSEIPRKCRPMRNTDISRNISLNRF